ncbi:hypothetical protein SEA_WIDOW_58 [Gordonia phage Widow]|nr:hypothetical protein SEA_PUPPERS_58 [Gordonia phage Puppers]UTN93350.1 hypothetical protein SEA_WIDOW_58 [Gordonia phage Widow]
MSSKSEIGVELRRRTYQYGPGVYRTVRGTKREAVLDAAKLSHHYESEGVAFTVGERLPSREWPIMVDAVPLLEKGQPLHGRDARGVVGPDLGPELKRRAEAWGVVLIRMLTDRSGATTSAHRENTDRSAEIRAMGRYRSHRVGGGSTNRRYGVFFYLGAEEAAS